MRIALAVAACVLASPAVAEPKYLPVIIHPGDEVVQVMVHTREWRIFPSLPDPERSGTVPLHLHFVGYGEGDSGDPAGRGYGGYGGTFGSGHGDGGVDSLGKPRTANSLMRSDWGPYNTGDDYGGPQHGHSGSGGTAGDGGWGGYSAGDGGWGWD